MKSISTQDKDISYIEFSVASTLYSEPDKDGNKELIKKDIRTKLSVYIEDITGHEEVFNNKGKVLQRFCRIYHKDIGQVIVCKSYDQVSEIKRLHHSPEVKSVGFTNRKNVR